ncbi:uncharacterized protein H6S33_010403 [Morchella sextelata]|uniref:uncharacterized protein n=1 Tax=Morchella sextelata TaxID=1174677 RepID=UPI001D049EA8|nr:uncharacterized protein H6S33_010403 [Morchella sextelata]KAH0612351.1 hypothetical protein H6S33_010403 [Morchella sextelata]
MGFNGRWFRNKIPCDIRISFVAIHQLASLRDTPRPQRGMVCFIFPRDTSMTHKALKLDIKKLEKPRRYHELHQSDFYHPDLDPEIVFRHDRRIFTAYRDEEISISAPVR